MDAMASEITSLAIVYSTVYSGAGQRKHQSSASLASICAGNQRWPVSSPHKRTVTRKMHLFDDVIMEYAFLSVSFPLVCYLHRRLYFIMRYYIPRQAINISVYLYVDAS